MADTIRGYVYGGDGDGDSGNASHLQETREMMRVRALTSGSVIELSGSRKRATCISVMEQHPVWPQLSLVVWILDDNTVSLDALHPAQEVGTEVEILNRDQLKALMVGRHSNGDKRHGA